MSQYHLALEMAQKAKSLAQNCGFKAIGNESNERLLFIKTSMDIQEYRTAVIESLYQVETTKPVNVDDSDTASSSVSFDIEHDTDSPHCVTLGNRFTSSAQNSYDVDDCDMALPVLVENEIESSLENEEAQIASGKERLTLTPMEWKVQ